MAGFLHRETPGNGRFFVSPPRCSRCVRGPSGRVLAGGPTGAPPIVASGVTILALVILLFSACSSSDPRIMQIDHRLIAKVSSDTDAVTEYLFLSVDVADPDGEGEVESLLVSLPEAGVSWTVPLDVLTVESREGQTWYTTPHLSVVGSDRFPRGGVDVTVVDLSGREDHRSIALPLTLPEVTADDAIAFDAETATFRLPASGGTYLIGYRQGSGPREVRELVDTGTTVTAALLAEQLVRAVRGSRRGGGGAGGDAAEELTVWGIVEWSPLLWIESGPWTLDPSRGDGDSAAE
jgi:hypothetical protein